MDIKAFNSSNMEKMNNRLMLLRESEEWSSKEFNTSEEIESEIAHLESELEKKNMNPKYYENVQKHIEELRTKMEHPIDENAQFKEKDVLDDGEFIKRIDKIEKSAKSLDEASKMKKKFCESVELDNISEGVLGYAGLMEERLPKDSSQDPEYGVPEEKKYPLFDKQHVISAIKLFGHVNPKYEAELAHRITRRMKEYDIPYDMVGKDNKLYQYLPKSVNEEALEENKKQAYRDGGNKLKDYQEGQARAIRMSQKRSDSNSRYAARSNYENWASKKAEKTDPDGTFQKAYNNGGKDHAMLVTKNVMKNRDGKPTVIKGTGKEALEKFNDTLGREERNVEDKFNKYKKRGLESTNESIESEKPANTEVLNMVRADLQDELSAIKNYDEHADLCEANGFVTIGEVLRDIRDEEKVHVGELQKVLSVYDSQYKESIKSGEREVDEKFNKPLTESVLDPVHKERCKELWENGKIKPEVKKFILDTLEEFKKNLNYELNIKNIFIIGSSSGYQYTDTSDVDCTVIIEKEFSDEEYDDFKKILPNGHNVPGTQHPVNYFFTATFADKNAENIYDLINDSWIKDTPKEESELPTGYILQLSKFFMNSLDLTFSEYRRDKQEYLGYKEMDPAIVEISEKEKHEAMDKKLTEIKADLDSLRIGNHVIRGFLHEAYESDDNQYTIHIEIENPNKDPRKSINNLVYKCLEKFGYREKLDSIIAEAEDFIKQESPSEEAIHENWEEGAEHDVYTWMAPDGSLVRYYDPDDRQKTIDDWHKKHKEKIDEPKEDKKQPLKESAEVSVNPTKGNPLTEAVTFIDNAGNLKTMSAENYNKDMHEYNTKYQIKRFRLSKNRSYKLRDDEK